MCFELDSTPPITPIAGAAVNHRDLELTAADGTAFAAFEATGDDPTGAAVVILPDVRGLYRFYEELALRFAERGHDAVAIDYFGRSAGVGKRDDEFPFRDHVAQTTQEGVRQDTAAAIAHLRAADPERPVFVMGFCFGGSNAWHQAANGHGIAGAIGFYGNPTRENVPQGAPSVISRAKEIECPVLGLMGGDDQGIPQEAVDELEAAWKEAGVNHEIVVYPGAPHSFFDRRYEDFAKESEDAWQRVLAFMEARS